MQFTDYEVESDSEEYGAPELPNFQLRQTEFESEHPELEDEEARIIESTQSYIVPDVVKQFVGYFYRHIKDRNVFEIYSMYENTFNKVSEKFFKNSPWPPAEAIANLVHNDTIFLILYRELYYRHIYKVQHPSVEHRFDSWKNYCDLFNSLLNSPPDLNLELPNQWLWDIIDEFIYQFQDFCQYSSKLKKSQEELTLLKNNQQVWNVTNVINFLHALVTKSNIVQTLEREKQGPEGNANHEVSYANHQLYKMLGYFSLIGLLRIHTLLGDYHLALKVIAPIELNNKGLYTKVTACHITLFYFLGFVYMMLRRYIDSIRTYANILLYINRTKQYHTKSLQYDSMLKKQDQMYSLLAICISLCPQRVDENVHSALRDKYGEKMLRMQKGDIAVFEELFSFASPKFISPAVPPYAAVLEDPTKYLSVNLNQEAMKLQTKIFLKEISQQASIPVIRSYLKLYTTIATKKLSAFLEVDEKTCRTQLLCYKHKAKGLAWNGGAPLNGEVSSYSDVDFFLEKDMVHIIDTKVARRYSEFFVRHTDKLLNLS